ncbi:PREDICTED: intercellular adhesion molecule 1 [Propithecus coquereli]|uniref:Intercellular adhesion molecule 1 n=1 Tax=Propithecus coquereli TaxID=379532 RepID=A0A2K6FV18_PROCO|nr:PREDICTED: intercellular adhesion molecule 1 [Propithecus coquereli]
MAPGDALPALPALLALLGALLPGPGGAQTFVFPQKATLPRGGSVQVNCSSSCDQQATLGLETDLAKTEVARGNNWRAYELSSVHQDSNLICFSVCDGHQTMASASLTVYWCPDQVELAPLPPWQPVGENLTLHCQVTGGAPRSNLTVVFLRGEEELNRQPVVGEPAEVTATVPVARSDHGLNFSCRAELDLRPLGLGLFENTSAPHQLRTFVLPSTGPQLDSPWVLEMGTQGTVVCFLDGLFPVSEAQVHLALGDRRLDPTITYHRDSLSAKAPLEAKAEEEGSHQLTCAVMLGNQSRETRQSVTVYSFPEPTLTLSKPEVSEGTEVIVECQAQAEAVVTLSGVPAGPPGPLAQFLLNASAEDNGRRFSCSAALEVAGQVLQKNRTRELRVLYGPWLDERDCPGNWTWKEGSQQTLRCQARGNPSPHLNCSREKDGALLPIGNLSYVTRNLSGTYVCRAISSRGELTREVSVTVTYSDHQNIVVIVVVTILATVGAVASAAYIYNHQRKIKKYKLQKAQKATTMKLNTQATPP